MTNLNISKKYYFMAGLPRSGSTLLSALLNQHPDIHSEPYSAVCPMTFNVEESLKETEQYKIFPKPEIFTPLFNNIIDGYYSNSNSKIIIDKNREWSFNKNLELLKNRLNNDVKIIMPVRGILDILYSWIMLLTKDTSSDSILIKEFLSSEYANPDAKIVDALSDWLMRPDGIIDNSLKGIKNALHDNNKQFFHFIEYDDLLDNPQEELNKIYNFLNIDSVKNDFDNIVHSLKENDKVLNLPGLHEVRPKLFKRDDNYKEVLSEYVINKYSNLEVWRK